MKTTGEDASSVCVVCGDPEAQWSCQRKGCNRTYHLHCVKTHQPDDFITVGVWCCVDCIKKKLQFGSAFACDEIESIWDVEHGKTEVKYWVKYMKLAHVHNCWIPESKIHRKTPELLARFVQEYQINKDTSWKKEWTKPERLLLCRNLMHVDMAQKFFQDLDDQLQYCNTEWLVKWKGLGYEHATWELGSLNFLHSSEAERLKQDYNCRQVDAARRANFSSENNKIVKEPFVRLEAFPSEFLHGLGNGLLDSLNRLRQLWHKSQNAVLIDQKERVTRLVLFIKSIIDHSAQPVLILTMIESLSLWEETIRQLIPSVHIVVHTNRFTNFLVEVTEFWGQNGHLLFQVLLSSPDAIQGFEAIKLISWEGVIVDQCDNMNMSTHLEQIKTLSADFKMLILNKNDPSLYVTLLSVLEPGDAYIVPDSSILKEKFSRYIAYQAESDSSTCEIVPFTGEKEGPLSEVLDKRKRDCSQYLSAIVNPRKRKESPNDVVDFSVFYGAMIEKSTACLKGPTSTGILESSWEELVQVNSLSLTSTELDDPANADISVSEKKNQIVCCAKRSNFIFALKDKTRTIHLLLKLRLLRMHEMFGIPDNVNSVANMFLNHVLKSHREMVAPFIILKHFMRGTLEVVLGYETSPLNKQREHFIHWFEIAKRFFTQHLPRLGYNDAPITISPNVNHELVVPQEDKSLEQKIETICDGRENKLHALHNSELLDLEMIEKREGGCYWRAYESVLKNRHTMAKSDKNSHIFLKNTIEKFKAFQKHMVFQRRRLELLQEKARALEKLRKEEWVKMVKSGELEESFDFSQIPLPESGFVFENFGWVCGEIVINHGSSSQENVLEKLDHGQSTVGRTSVGSEASTNMGGAPNGAQHDVTIGRKSTMRSKKPSRKKGSNPPIPNSATQQEIGTSTIYTGSSAAPHDVRISPQLIANIIAEEISVNVEELLLCAEMLSEPVERETSTSLTSTQVSMPEIGVSALSRTNVCLHSSNDFLEMPPFTQEMFPNGLNQDPFVNELIRINHGIRNLTKNHEQKKLGLRSQREAEVQNFKRKYEALMKDTDATFRKHKKFLECLTRKVEGGEIVDKELRAFEMETESDIPEQVSDQNQPPAPQNSSSQMACGSQPAIICASSGLGHCMPSCHNTHAQPVEISQAPCVQTNLSRAPPVTSSLAFSPLSTSPEFQIFTNVAPTTSSSLGATPVNTIHIPRFSNQASAVAANIASTSVSSFHTGDEPARLDPRMIHIWNQPTQGISTVYPFNYHQQLNPDTLRMSPSTSWNSSVQKSSTPIITTAPGSYVQIPHVQANLAPPLWNNLPVPTSTSQVSPVIASMSCPFPTMVAPRPPTIYPGQQTHLYSGRSPSVMRNLSQPVLTNWVPPVQTTSLPGPPPGPHHYFNYPYMLRSPSPHMRHLRPHISMRRPQAPIPDLSYNVSSFGGSFTDPNQRSGH